MSYSKDVGEVSARYRSADEVPSVTYPPGTHVVFTAPGSATNGQYGLSEWNMSGTRGGAGPHFHQTFSESFYGFMPDGGPAQVDARGLPGQAAGRSVIEIWIAPDGRDATALSRRTGSGRTGAPVHGSTPHDRTVILRCTRKLLTVLGSAVAEPAPPPGDWYANLLRFDRRTCLLLTHSGTLFTIVEAGVPGIRFCGPRASWSPASSGGSCPAKSCRRGRPAIWAAGGPARQDGGPQRPGRHERHGVQVRARHRRRGGPRARRPGRAQPVAAAHHQQRPRLLPSHRAGRPAPGDLTVTRPGAKTTRLAAGAGRNGNDCARGAAVPTPVPIPIQDGYTWVGIGTREELSATAESGLPATFTFAEAVADQIPDDGLVGAVVFASCLSRRVSAA